MACALLIDDHDGVLESIQSLADNADLHLDTANSWEEGLASFHQLAPELVICDYQLPGSKHGLKLLAQIREYRPSIRLVLLSGYLDTETVPLVEGLGIVQRAVIKGMAETGQILLDEIRACAARPQQEGTDWTALADAHLKAEAVSDADLDALDKILTAKAEGA